MTGQPDTVDHLFLTGILVSAVSSFFLFYRLLTRVTTGQNGIYHLDLAVGLGVEARIRTELEEARDEFEP